MYINDHEIGTKMLTKWLFVLIKVKTSASVFQTGSTPSAKLISRSPFAELFAISEEVIGLAVTRQTAERVRDSNKEICILACEFLSPEKRAGPDKIAINTFSIASAYRILVPRPKTPDNNIHSILRRPCNVLNWKRCYHLVDAGRVLTISHSCTRDQ